MRIAEVASFRNDDVQIAEVFDLEPQFLQFLVQVRITQSGRPHVDPSAIRAKVHRHAND